MKQLLDAKGAELARLIEPLTDTERNNALQSFASQGVDRHADLMSGLVFSVLTDRVRAPVYLRYLAFVVRDYGVVIARVRYVLERLHVMQPGPRDQLVTLIEFLMAQGVADVDTLTLLLRHVRGGDVSADNISFTERVLQLFQKQRFGVFWERGDAGRPYLLLLLLALSAQELARRRAHVHPVRLLRVPARHHRPRAKPGAASARD